MTIKINECPNCKNKSFGGLGADGGSTTAALVSATKNNDGNYELNETYVLAVTPLICDECGHVMLFKKEF